MWDITPTAWPCMGLHEFSKITKTRVADPRWQIAYSYWKMSHANQQSDSALGDITINVPANAL